MKVIVGLGNPGKQYEHARHNVGWRVVEAIAARLETPAFTAKPKLQAEISKKNELLLVKPLTYMNHSGQAVRSVLEYFTDWQERRPLPWLFVIHDDLDLVIGAYKLQLGTGPKDHHGLLSLYQHLGTKEFWHVRIGVDGRWGDRTVPSEEYVLQHPGPAEMAKITTSIEAATNQLIKTI